MARVAGSQPWRLSSTHLGWGVRSLRTNEIPKGRCNCDRAIAHRERLVTAVAFTGTGLLGASLATEPDSTEFYVLTFAVAGTWLVGGLASNPPHLRPVGTDDHSCRRLMMMPILTGAVAFGAFFGAALVARRIPVLNEALTSVLSYADRGLRSVGARDHARERGRRRGLLPWRPVHRTRSPKSSSGIDGGVHAHDQRYPQSGSGVRIWGNGLVVRGAAARLRRYPGTDPDSCDLVSVDAPIYTVPVSYSGHAPRLSVTLSRRRRRYPIVEFRYRRIDLSRRS